MEDRLLSKAVNVLAALKPNQPNHRIKAPAEAREEYYLGQRHFRLPSELNLPFRAPNTVAMKRQSIRLKHVSQLIRRNPSISSSANHPSAFQTQCPEMGYTMPTTKKTIIIYVLNNILSATAPDMIEITAMANPI